MLDNDLILAYNLDNSYIYFFTMPEKNLDFFLGVRLLGGISSKHC